MKNKENINVTCAIIIDKKIVVTQRSEKMKLPLKWKFPCAKLENNGSEIDCIKRNEHFIDNKSITHITTNLSATEIEKLYGTDCVLE